MSDYDELETPEERRAWRRHLDADELAAIEERKRKHLEYLERTANQPKAPPVRPRGEWKPYTREEYERDMAILDRALGRKENA
jgi:hypothetical protein